MRRHQFVLLLAVLLAVTLAAPTGGVSSSSMDRGVRVSVVADDEAYLGFAQTATNTTEGTTDLEVAVTNRLPSALATAAVTVDGVTTDVAGGSLASGASATATFTGVDCGAPITVDASGDSVAIRLNRTVDCS